MTNPYAPPSPDRTPDDERPDADRAPDDRTRANEAADDRDRRPDEQPRPPVPQHPQPPQHPHPYPPGPDPAPGPGPGPGPGPVPGPQDAPAPDAEALARVGRVVRQFSVWLVAGVVVSLLPAPWRLATVVFLVGAAVAGVRALHAAGTARLRGGLLPLLTAGLVMTGILLVGSLGSLATLPVDLERQTCLGSALTRSAQAACERAYEDGLEDLTGGLLGGATGS